MPIRASAFFAQAYPELEAPLCRISSRPAYPPLLNKFIARLDPALDDFLCERYLAEIQPTLDRWASSLRDPAAGVDALRDALAGDFRGCSLSPSQAVTLRSSGPLRIEQLSFETTGEDRAAFVASWLHSLQSFTSIDSLDLQVFGIQKTDEAPLVVQTEIRYNLVGTAHDGSREERVGSWRLGWSWAGGPRGTASHTGDARSWLVSSWSAGVETRSRLRGPGFTDITSQCFVAGSPGMRQLNHGIDHWRTALDGASGIDIFGNHGLALGDVDGSGCDSLYICQPAGLPNRLYRNRADGSFEDVTERSGTGLLDGTASALFADFRNRGVQDLLVVRSSGPLLFENLGDCRFQLRPDAFHFDRPPQGTFTGAAAADYNRDGLLDVYLCVYSYYKGLDHHQYPSPYYDAQNGPPNFLFRNRGDGTFADVTQSSGVDANNNRFSFAASWCDYDDDGWPDLYVANDFGRKNLYHNNRDGTFSDFASRAGVEDYGPGMSTCWFDADNDGRPDLYVANMWLAEGLRITADDQFLSGVSPAVRSLYRKHNAGNSLYRNKGDGSFADGSKDADTAIGGWSWSCASWDFDNDGWADLYVANGFVSGPDHADLQSFFWRQVAQRSMTPTGVSPEYQPAWNAIHELLRSDYSWSGYQRNVFFANHRDGTFSTVSGALGLDLIDDARAFGLSDLDGDGRLEIVLKNRTGPQVRVLRNDLQDIGNAITVRLRGQTSNRDAIGARVSLRAGAPRQTQFVAAGSGFASQHTKDLCFGVADAAGPVSLAVRWPTGQTQHFDGLPVNHRVLLTEGLAHAEAQPYRIRPARVTPGRDAAGSVDADSSNPWLLAPLFAPDLQLAGNDGASHLLSALRGKPVLLTFLNASCDPSLQQLTELQNGAGTLDREGVQLFLVVVDRGSEHAAIDTLVKQAHCTLPVCVADERLAGAWNLLYRYIFDRRLPLGAPASFLLDRDGAVVRVYREGVTCSAIAEDALSMPTTDAERLARALPFAGPYHGAPMRHDYLSFGIAFSESGYIDEAQAAFGRAIDNNPGLQVAWFNLGTIFLNKKRYADARRCLKQAVQLNPGDSDAWNNLGSLSGTEQKYDEALEEFRQAVLANPQHANALENMMHLYQFQSRAADAQKTLEQLIAKSPNTASLHLALSLTLVAQNDLPRAREELETAVRLDPTNADALNNLGAVLLHMGLAPQALQRFEECRRIAPDFDRAAINVALLYHRNGQDGKAQQLLEEFLKRHPEDREVQATLNRMQTP